MSHAPIAPAASSFRDPCGYVAQVDGEFVRVVLPAYQAHYRQLESSGLRAELEGAGLLLRHEELDGKSAPGAFKVLRPRQLSFVSYPYEWCFSQWRDAALVTLEIQERAIARGMTLRDASAFNIQFVDGRPMLIDLLSFAVLDSRPWAAYGQFCRHFLAPLALMATRDVRLGQLFRAHLDGVPLDLAASLLPTRTKLKPSLLLHLHAHAASERWLDSDKPKAAREKKFSRESLLGLVRTLRSAIEGLRWNPRRQHWASYYSETVTGGGYVAHKQRVVADWLRKLQPRTLWDLGANTGVFSRIAAEQGIETISFDGDIECVELNYCEVREHSRQKLLPLYLDLSNPTPALGWEHRERMSWLERQRPDAVLALALVHHLAIGNNLPLPRLAEFFARLAPQLIIEFVPKDDPNAQKLLWIREDIFTGYTRDHFEAEFRKWFSVETSERLENSERILYLMHRTLEP